MKNKANYTTNRNYRDFVIDEEEPTTIKNPVLLKKSKSILEKIVDLVRGK
jgi:hypothetical protein